MKQDVIAFYKVTMMLFEIYGEMLKAIFIK